MTIPTPEQLRSAVNTAHEATEGITDPQLRAVALGRVLDHLLAAAELGSPQPSGRSPPMRSSPAARVVAASGNGPRKWIESLVGEGFFSNPKSLAAITEAVRAQGHRVESKNVTDPLVKLVQAKILRRENRSGPEAKRGVWLYSDY